MLGRLSVGNRLSPTSCISPAPQVYSATNVELVTRTRTEHLSDQDKSRNKGKARCACLLPSHVMWWGHSGLGGQSVWDTLGGHPIPICSVSPLTGGSQGGGGAIWGQWPKGPSWAPTLLRRGEDSVPVLPRDGPAALLPQWGEPALGGRGWGPLGRARQVPP